MGKNVISPACVRAGVRVGPIVHRLFLLFLFILLPSGCHHLKTGTFHGTLSHDRSLEELGPSTQLVRIQFEREKPNHGHGIFIVSDLSGKPLAKVEATGLHLGRRLFRSIKVRISSITDFYLKLNRDKSLESGALETECYSTQGDSSQPYTVELCYLRDQFRLDVRAEKKALLALWGTFLAPIPAFPQPKGEIFTVAAAIDRALKYNYDALIELTNVRQVKEQMRFGFLRQLPNFNTGLAFIIPGINAMGFASALDSFAPFLLFNRWIEAAQGVFNFRGAKDSNLISRANLAAQVETLIYNHVRDQSVEKVYQDLLYKLEKEYAVLEKARFYEHLGRLKKGTADTVETTIRQIRDHTKEFHNHVRGSRADLAEVLGFMSPSGVENVSIGEETIKIETADPLDDDDQADLAAERSLEVRQLKHLIDFAKAEKIKLFFSWIDPAGDQNANLGFGLFSQFKIAKSKIHLLEYKQKQMIQIVKGQARQFVRDYNFSISHHATQKILFDLQQKRLKEILEPLMNAENTEGPIDFNPYYFQSIASNDYLDSGIAVVHDQANFRVDRAMLDRLLLRGNYERVFLASSSPD